MTRLGDLFEITSSKRVHKEDWRSEGIPFFRAREIVQFFQTGAVRQELYITPEMYREFKSKYGVPQPEDLLVTGVGTLGVCYRVRDNAPFYFKDGNIIWLKKRNDSDTRFIEYAFQSDLVRDQIMSGSQGATVGTYTIEKANETLIPIPPLPEQQRIVTKLDAAFAALAEAQAHVERNRANARELFESYLNGVFEGKGDGWSRETLGTLGKIMYGYTASSTSEPVGPRLLRITDIQDEQVEWTQVPHCQITDEDFAKYELRTGDIVFARTGATTGKSFLIESAPEAVFASYLIRVQVESDEMLPEFLILYFRTRLYWDAIKAGTTGSAQGGFNATKLSELMVPFPSKKEQRTIVRQANKLKDETKQLETTYAQKLTELEGLKKAVLGAAFRGEL